MPDAFLDSSALIEIVFRHRVAREKAEAAIPSGARRLTSRYVLFEIARGYLLALLILHNKAIAIKSLAELHEYMHSGSQLFRPYRSKTMLGAFVDFLVHLETLGISLTEEQRLFEFRAWMAQYLRRGWRQLSRVAEIINRVGCREDIPPPSPKANHHYEQRLPTRDCGVADACGLNDYISNHRSDFHDLANGLAALENWDQETERRINALRRLLGKPTGSDFVGKDCWRCGDAIICHEAPIEATVVSKNRKHFEPLCVIIGRKLIAYS